MRLPKQFKLHELAELDDNDILILNIGDESVLVSSSSNGIAIVPITFDENVELPLSFDYEDIKDKVISSKAMKEAVKGKTDIGEIRFRKSDQMVRSGDTKNWILIKNPDPKEKPTTPELIEKLKKEVDQQSPYGYHYAEVCLDAELLSILSRAIGTSKVRLRFLVNKRTKIADGQKCNLIKVTPYRKDDGDGQEAILSMLLTNKR
jgi:hypothetical protein